MPTGLACWKQGRARELSHGVDAPQRLDQLVQRVLRKAQRTCVAQQLAVLGHMLRHVLLDDVYHQEPGRLGQCLRTQPVWESGQTLTSCK